MHTLKKSLIIGLFLITYSALFSQDIKIGLKKNIFSNILRENRPISVYLPASYYSNTNSHYPVLYILDGDYNFRYVTGLIELQSHISEHIPEMIVVAISGKGTKKYRKNCKLNIDVEDKGNADKVLLFIEKELLPFVNANFRTSKYNILSGHSVGGIFVSYAALTKSNLFNHYIAISPALWWGNSAINNLVSNTKTQPSLFVSLANEKGMKVQSFLSVATSSFVTNKFFIYSFPFVLALLVFLIFIKKKRKYAYLVFGFFLGALISLYFNFYYYPTNHNFKFKKFTNENHNSVGEPTYKWALNSIFNDWKPTEKYFENNQGLIDLNKKVTSSYKESFNLPKGVISNTVFYILNKDTIELKKIKNSISKLYPEQLGFYNSLLVDLYLKQKKYDEIEKIIHNELSKSTSVDLYRSISKYYLETEDFDLASLMIEKALQLSKNQKLRQWEINELLEVKSLINAKKQKHHQ